MRRAIALSKRGYPAPNPHVGCVVVAADGMVAGEGFHAFASGAHAEVVALTAAGAKAKGATAFVTLEPCSHRGRTPPCVDALIAAGVARVVVACRDPNPVAASGLELLVKAGISTEIGVCEAEARIANEPWLEAMRLRRPFVTVKAAMSLDGRIALPSGESRWITGEPARNRAHRLRAECGAVLVGRRTVEIDDPRLTARIRGVVNQPVRVLLDPNSRLERDRAAFGPGGQTLVAVARASRPDELQVPFANGSFDLPKLLEALWERGTTGLLVEGGANTVAAFMRAGLVDRIALFVAPIALGAGPAWTADFGLLKVADAPRFQIRSTSRLGVDALIVLTPDRT